MALMNYTTKVPVGRTLQEITTKLVKAGARGVATEYDGHGRLVGIEFAIRHGNETLSYTLPCRVAAVREVLKRQRVEARYLTAEHMERVAWRILGDWVAAQLAIIETEMVSLPQIMLPYLRTEDGSTVFERFETTRALPAGA
jgi:YD repeat-containing protein